MPVHDDLGIRMKTFYEQIPKTKLMKRCPVAIRIGGKYNFNCHLYLSDISNGGN